jgi:integrase
LAKGGWPFKEPKTKKSRRHVALHADALEALRKHKAQQNAVRLALGGEDNTEGLVFPNPMTGEAWVPDRFSSAFYYQARKADFNVSFRGLRHSCATIAQRAGASLKDTSDSLGHSAIGITADMYSHVFDDSRRGVSEKVGDALAEARKKTG